jgi:glucose-1-phosphate cytidylyltransferase
MISVEDSSGMITGIQAMNNGHLRINGGFFIFKREIFEYIRAKEELVSEPFQRLLSEGQLVGYLYDGFWASMDTFKDKQELEGLYSSGTAPWEVWKANGNGKGT